MRSHSRRSFARTLDVCRPRWRPERDRSGAARPSSSRWASASPWRSAAPGWCSRGAAPTSRPRRSRTTRAPRLPPHRDRPRRGLSRLSACRTRPPWSRRRARRA